MSLLPTFSRVPVSVRRMGFDDANAAREYLIERPAEYSFCLGWMDECGILPRRAEHRYEYLAATRGEEILGMGLIIGGTIACLATLQPSIAARLGLYARRSGMHLRTIVGPRRVVAAFWEAYAGSGTRVRLVQDQHFFELRSRELRVFGPSLIETAEMSELDELLAVSLDMFFEETGLQVAESDRSTFREALHTKIESGRVWRLRDPDTGELLFKASVASWSSEAAQLEGVYVPKHHRGRGFSKLALGELCRRLLASTRRLTLYANTSNEAALRLYERLGFRKIVPYRTLFVDVG